MSRFLIRGAADHEYDYILRSAEVNKIELMVEASEWVGIPLECRVWAHSGLVIHKWIAALFQLSFQQIFECFCKVRLVLHIYVLDTLEGLVSHQNS